jgi:hypothetical protein
VLVSTKQKGTTVTMSLVRVTTAVNTSTASKAEAPMADPAAIKPYEESRFPQLFRRIKNLAKISDNWNSYGAAAPNRTARFWARRILHELVQSNLEPIAVTASSDEGVALFFQRGTKQASIECLNTGEILAVVSEQTGAPQVWPISQDANQIKREIGTLHKFLTK